MLSDELVPSIPYVQQIFVSSIVGNIYHVSLVKVEHIGYASRDVNTSVRIECNIWSSSVSEYAVHDVRCEITYNIVNECFIYLFNAANPAENGWAL